MTSQWARFRLKLPAPRLFTQPFIHAQIKENTKFPRHWLLCGEFTFWPVNSPQKWPGTQEMPPFDDVIMWHRVIVICPSTSEAKLEDVGRLFTIIKHNKMRNGKWKHGQCTVRLITNSVITMNPKYSVNYITISLFFSALMYWHFLLANNLDFALPGEVKGLNATYLEKITLINWVYCTEYPPIHSLIVSSQQLNISYLFKYYSIIVYSFLNRLKSPDTISWNL